MSEYRDLLAVPESPAVEPLTNPLSSLSGEPATQQPQLKPQRKSEYRSLLDGPSEQDAALGSNLVGAASTTPDAHAKAMDVGKTIGAPADSVASNMQESERLARLQRYRDALNDAPKMQKLLAEDPDLAKISADDLKVLGDTESTFGKILSAFYGVQPGNVQAVGDLGRSVAGGLVGDVAGSGLSGLSELNEVAARTIERGLRAVGLDTAADILTAPVVPWWLNPSGILKQPGEALKEAGGAIKPPEERQNLATDIAGGVGQVVGQIALALLTGGTSTTAMLLGQGADIMAERVEKAGKAGTAEGDTAIVAASGVTAMLEKLGLEALLHRVPPAVKNTILRQLTDISIAGGIEALEEAGEGILHNLIEMVTVNPDAKLLDGLEQDMAAGGGTGAVIRALVNAATKGRQISHNAQRQQRAGQEAATVEALVTGTADSKLRDRNPDAFARVMAAQTQGTPVETFYVPATAIAELYQGGSSFSEDEDPLNQIDGLREQYQEALAVGGDVEISAADYLTHIAPTDLHGKLKNDLRASRDGWSVNDAKAYAENPDRESDLAALVEKLALENEGAAVGQTVFDDTYKQLMDTGRYESRQAAAQATLVREKAIARAARRGLGEDVDALYLRDQLKIFGPGALARVRRGDLDLVIARLKSGETVTADKTPVLDIVRKAGGVKPGSNLAGELQHMGITARTHPGLFRKTGIGDVDNFVLSEHDVLADNGIPDSGSGYADRDAVLEALRREAGGRGAALLTQDERSQAARLDEPVAVLAEQLEAAGLDPATMTAEEIKAWMTDATSGDLANSYIVFEPTQIKSVNNRGTFDPNDPRILFQTATPSVPAAFGAFTVDGRDLLRDGKKVGTIKLRAEGGANPHIVVDDIEIVGGKGQGTGTAALQALIQTAHGQGLAVALTTDAMRGKEHQKRLRAYYERLGFVKNRGAGKVKGVDAEYVSPAPAGGTELYQSVYHGSPHIFDAFSTAAIGTGEGAQIYGFGLYFAGKKAIAQWYREKLTPPGKVTRNGADLKLSDAKAAADDLEIPRAIGVAGTMMNRLGKSKSYDDYLSQLDEILADPNLAVFPSALEDVRNERKLAEHLDAEHLITVTPSKAGRLYTVEIPDDGEYLLHDKPLSEQPEAVRKAISDTVGKMYERAAASYSGDQAGWGDLKSDEPAPTRDAYEASLTGNDFYRAVTRELGSDRAASEHLLSLGVRGIKYLDASARDSSGDSFNYVVFADSDAVIQAYEQSAAGGARGSYQRAFDPYGNPANIIRLTQGADLSTFLHEASHFFLFQLIDDSFDPAVGPEAKAKLQADLQKILDHVGVKVDVATSSANAVHAAMTRDAHELWARSFEVYLREGKAPSTSLRDAFASFSAWLTRIYKTLTSIPDYRKNLTPEVRGVMDRLLATDDAIKDAQNASSFRVPSALRQVMTAAEQKSLERLTELANREAKEDLLKRVMRELERERLGWWKEERAKVRTEIEGEARNRPVYRAYNIIRSGKTADGGQLVDENGEPRAMKLDRKQLERDYGKDVIKLLPKGLTAKDGASHHVVAGLTGFGSADEMRDALMNFRPMKEVVEEETDAAMKARHGDMLSDGRLAEDAAKLVLNERQLELAALQAKALRRLASSVVKKAAARTVAETGAGSASSDRARVAEAQADVEAVAGMGAPAEGVAGLSVEAEMARATAAAGVGQRGAQRAALRQTRGITSGLDLKAIQAAAKRAVAGKRVEDAVPGRYRAQADRLGRQIEEAIAERDYETAATLKEKQLINLALAKEAQEAQAKVEKAVKRFARLRKPDSKLAGGGDVDFIGAARAILSVFGLSSPQAGYDEQVWFQKLEENDPAGAVDMKQMIEAAKAGVGRVAARGRTRTRQPPGGQPEARGEIWRQMTLDEFGSLTDTVDGILAMGRAARSVELDGERLEIKATVSELIAQASGRDKGERIGQTAAVTWKQELSVKLLGISAALERMETWARRMDEGAVGPYTKYFIRPVLKAVYEYREAKGQHVKQLVDLLEPHRKELYGKPIHSDDLRYTFANKAALLHAVLHSGNDSNFRKLLLGGRGKNFAWGKLNQDGSVDSSRWDNMIRVMVRDGVLTKADYDLAQSIWDLLEATKGPAQIAHRKMKGYYFDEVEITGIQTPFGQMRGGYVPAITDRLLNADKAAQADADAMGELGNAGMLPSVARGFTKSRVEYNQPLELDLALLPSHVDKVLKFTYLGPVIRSVTRLAINRDFKEAMHGVDPTVLNNLVIPWLHRVSRQTLETPSTDESDRTADQWWRLLRRNTAMQAMAGNVVNALQQVTGLSTAMVRVKPGFILRGLVNSVKAPRVSIEEIKRKSPLMRERMDGATQDLIHNLDEILSDKWVGFRLVDKANRHGYFAQAIMQNLVDRVVWLGAYEQATAGGRTDEEAALEADSVVRTTQGSFSPEDASKYEAKSAFVRAFTMFYSYFNGQMNLLRSEAEITVRESGWVGASPRLFYIYVFGAMIPAVMAEAIVQAAKGQLGDDDDDGLWDDIGELFLLSQLRYFAAMVPIVGPAVTAGINFANSKPYDDRLSTSPVVSSSETVIRTLAQHIPNALSGEGVTTRAIRDALTTLGMLTGLPLGQAGKPLGYIADVATGEQQGEDLGDWLRGLLSGREAPKQ